MDTLNTETCVEIHYWDIFEYIPIVQILIYLNIESLYIESTDRMDIL